MELRKRQAKILQDLFEKKRISVDTILDEYGISKRTLYYDLNKINDWLSEDNFGMANIEDKEIVIEITNLAANYDLIAYTSPVEDSFGLPLLNATGFLVGINEDEFIEELMEVVRNLKL